MSEDIQNQEAQEAAPSLSIQDLIGVIQIINTVTARGAIQATELSKVGTIYDKIIKFLEHNGAITRPTDTPQEPAQPQA